MSDTKTVPLFNPNDGVTGRDGGPYLDNVEQHLAESRRAVAEKRDPDFEKLLATAGVPLVTGAQLVNQGQTTSLPSQAHNDVIGVLLEMHAEDELGAPKIDEIEVPTGEVSPVADDMLTKEGAENERTLEPEQEENPEQVPDWNLATDADAGVSQSKLGQ